MTPLEMLLIGFAVGLTGAMVPGPMLFATIESSLKTGWTAGPKIVFGHALLEIFTCILIIAGMTAIMNERVISAISLIGGISLIVFGGMILKGREKAGFDIKSSSSVTNPVLAGIMTSASNPFFWLWWLSAGNGLLVEGLRTGLTAAGVFVLGHWMADTAWYSLVSGSFSRGRSLMPERLYRSILAACGMFLIVFGLWFIIRTL
ncbi:MAG: LysE family transporter [Candidatus Methanoperedens sp.]|nr:LysE family transporter [Candidatus Methanoperedens sp.]